MSISTRLVADRILTSTDRIDLLDGQGRCVRSMRGNGSAEVLMERKELAAGAYLVRLIAEDRDIARARFVVE